MANTDQPAIGKMGAISIDSISTLAGLSMLSVAKVDGLDIGRKSTIAFRSTWNTNRSGRSANNEILLPLIDRGTYDFYVDWGDSGPPDHITVYDQDEVVHTYASIGTYSISITGICEGWSFQQQPNTVNEGGSVPSNIVTDKLKIASIEEWGPLRLGATNSNFSGCANLTIASVIDVLNLSGTTDLYGLFYGCSSLTTINLLNSWSLSNITDTSYMFYGTNLFNQNIGSWNVGNVTNMKAMFGWYGNVPGKEGPILLNSFNNGGSTSINNWNTSKVTDMSYMFKQCVFNQPIASWNTLLVTNMSSMFIHGSFNRPILTSGNSWNVSNVTNMSYMFEYSPFNQDISNWNTSLVTDMSYMFAWTSFNYPLATSGNMWNVSNVTDMSYMFLENHIFNQELSTWNVSSVLDMSFMFSYAYDFNKDLNIWDVSAVQNMSHMFSDAIQFNKPLGSWGTKVSSVLDMSSMFNNTPFNQDISNWTPLNVTNMSFMFSNSSFNNNSSSLINNWVLNEVTNMTGMFFQNGFFDQPIDNWNTSKVTSMSNMFYQCIFNQDLSSWDTGEVITMQGMFSGNLSLFNQDISMWNVSKVDDFRAFLADGGFGNYRTNPFMYLDNIYSTTTGWASRPMVQKYWYTVPNRIDFGNSEYTSAGTAGRNIITGTYGWVINDLYVP